MEVIKPAGVGCHSKTHNFESKNGDARKWSPTAKDLDELIPFIQQWHCRTLRQSGFHQFLNYKTPNQIFNVS